MLKELQKMLQQSAELMIEEIISLSSGRAIEFARPYKIFIRDEKSDLLIELYGVSEGNFVFLFNGFMLQKSIRMLNWEEDYDIIKNVYFLTLENIRNVGIRSSNGVAGYRKSDR